MNALLFTLTLQQPLLIGQVGAGEENSAISLDFIAGSTIRGALISRYIDAHGQFDLNDPADDRARQLFFNGEVAFLNVYPCSDQGERTLPTPRSWHVEKDEDNFDSAKVIDGAIGNLGQLKDPKPLNARPYCAFDEETLTLYKPERQTGLHNASTERYIKREEASFVFRYDAIAAGQQFCGAILSADTTLLNQLEDLLAEKNLFLGGSRSAGYGHTVISEVAQVADWQEYQIHNPEQRQETMTLTLLSDAIVRDAHGQFTANLSELPAMQAQQLKPQAAFVVAGLTGGFNRTWGLPLPQMPMLRAGSVWTFAYSQATHDALQTLAATGIGERRQEGFGRIAINWPGRKAMVSQKHISGLSPRYTTSLSGQSYDLATRMVERLYRRRLAEKLIAHATGGLRITGTIPENNQLSRLRVMARQTWQQQDVKVLLTFLEKLKPLARNQYLRAQIEEKSLLAWLQEGLQNATLWNIHFVDQTEPLPKVGSVEAVATNAMKVEYMARLIDAICTRAIRERQAAAGKTSVGEVVT